ncbi:hypothetical protein SteCoe_345 [Stentor coeruleus]|uniref:Uncharacterized protein n=1 Tax=Stentor coeruleus TaxID=5963 RepID=A0A1R2D4J7_9CILI|nr:hypothetical protein SteCoe_345 [Stentor coeruleus]
MTESKNNKYLNFLQSTNNFLLVKDSMGKAKPSTRILPGEDYTYGKKLKADKEGVGALITSWAVHSSSKVPPPDKDFKKLNVLSITEGACTPATQSKFRNTVNVRIKSASQRGKIRVPDMIFGIENRPSTPIKAVMGNFYGEYAAENLGNNFTPKSVRKNIPTARSTRGFDKRNESIRNSMENPEKGYFKLKKYESIKAKTETRRK